MSLSSVSLEQSVQPEQPESPVAGSVRLWLQCEGAAVLALSLLLYAHLGARWWIFATLLLTPDLFMLAYLVNPRIGARSYNLVHSYVLPLACAIVVLAAHHPAFCSLVSIWTAHIGFDRMLGYGLKYPSAFGRTHLGTLGRQPV